MRGKLILENGMVFNGKVFGEVKETVGELVFNTGMSGYQELLTDPSYYGQMVIMTYPMIGNYGVNLQDMESDKIHLRALIIKEEAKLPNNFRCEVSLEGFLRQNKVLGFKGIDTRYLTKIIRDYGAMKGIITTKDLTKKEIEERFSSYQNKDAVAQVSSKEIYEIPGKGLRLGFLDFGSKRNIIRNFEKRDCHIIVFPWNTTAETILKYQVDGVFLSNGPGDPAELQNVIAEIKSLIAHKIPIVGICLGNQLAAWALGGTTKKMKFGHRGCNHPVKDLDQNRIFITSQNHGYAVDKIPEIARVSHISMNDDTVEGLKCEEHNLMTVQFHPEAWPGPQDCEYLFDEFLEVIKGAKKDVR